MFVRHVIGGGHVQKWALKRAHQRTLGFKPTLWSNTIWNDIRYPKIRVYINSTGFIGDLRMLEVLEILITFAMAVCI